MLCFSAQAADFTVNQVLKAKDKTTAVNSIITDTGTNVGVGITNPVSKFSVSGDVSFGGVSNYVRFDTNGKMTMVGGARVIDEIRIDAVSASKGVSAPTITLRPVGASGGVLKDVAQYSKTSQNDQYLEFHAPESMDETEPCHFHFMWIPGTSYTTGNYVWKVEYLVKGEHDAYNTGTPTTLTANVTPSNAVDMIETEFPEDIILGNQNILLIHFYRDVSADNADDTGDINLFEFEYTRNKQGT